MVFSQLYLRKARKRGEDLRRADGGGRGGFWAGKNRVLGMLALGIALHDKIID